MKNSSDLDKDQLLDSTSSGKDPKTFLDQSPQKFQCQSQHEDTEQYQGLQYLKKYQLLLQSKKSGCEPIENMQPFAPYINISQEIEQLKQENEIIRREKEELQRQLQQLSNNHKQMLLTFSPTKKTQEKAESPFKKLKIERAISEIQIGQSELSEGFFFKSQSLRENEEITQRLNEKQIQHDRLMSKHKEQQTELTTMKKQYKAIRQRMEDLSKLHERKEKHIYQLENVVKLKEEQIGTFSNFQEIISEMEGQLHSANQSLLAEREKYRQLSQRHQKRKKEYAQFIKDLQISYQLKNKEEKTKINNELAEAKRENNNLELTLRQQQKKIEALEQDTVRIKQKLKLAQEQRNNAQKDLNFSQEANFKIKMDLKSAQDIAKCKQTEIKNYKQKLESLTNEKLKINNSWQQSVRDYKQKLKAAEQENKEYLITLQKSQQQKTALLQELKNAQDERQSKIYEKNNSELKTAEVIKQKSKLQSQFASQNKKLKQLEASLTKEKNELAAEKIKTAGYVSQMNEYTRINNQSTKKINSLESTLKTKQTERSKNQGLIKSQSTTIEQYSNKIKSIQATLKTKQSQLLAKQKLNLTLKQENEQMKISDKKMKESVKNLQNELNTFRRQIQLFRKEKQNRQQYINRMEQQAGTLQKQKNNISSKLQQTLDFINTLERQVLCQETINPENLRDKDIELVIDKLNKLKYFPDSQILTNSPLAKHRFLCQQLKNFLQIQSFETKLLYKYPTLDVTNFHTYFDSKNNLVIMVKLTNGVIIGGFTVTPFLSERVPSTNKGKGFLFSLTTEKTFQMRSEPKQSITTYDHFFLILGNAEIRLRAGEKKVFSNFGIATSTFDNLGYPRTSFLGVQEQANNELQIESYQIYQVLTDKIC